MSTYDHVAFIYNPNSTGDASGMARRLRDALAEKGVESVLAPTDRAGHAVELAKDIAQSHTRPLIVSVSGDGGYHEVVNGVMSAMEHDSSLQPVVAVAGAGNANDHRRVIRSQPFMEIFENNSPRAIDLLHLEINGTSRMRHYAHSYIGLGITPEVAVELNKHQLSPIKELWIACKAFVKYKPFVIEHEGEEMRLDSLIFANINEMAKVIKLNDKKGLHDNQFEVVAFHHKGRLHLLGVLLRAAIIGLKGQPSHQTYSFKTLTDHSVQLDGELIEIPAQSTVTITSVPDAIKSLY